MPEVLEVMPKTQASRWQAADCLFALLAALMMLLVSPTHARVSCGAPGAVVTGSQCNQGVCQQICIQGSGGNSGAGGASSPPAQSWVSAAVAIAWHPLVPDVWAVSHVRGDAGGEQKAQQLALGRCEQAMGSGCEIATWFSNGVAAVMRNGNGFLRVTFAANQEAARLKAGEECKKDGADCSLVRMIESLPWLENRGERRHDRTQFIEPKDDKGGIPRSMFGAAAWHKDSSKVALAAGFDDPKKAEAAALDLCKSSVNPACVLAGVNANGYMVFAQDENKALHFAHGESMIRGRTAVLARCKEQNLNCTVLGANLSTKPGTVVVDTAKP